MFPAAPFTTRLAVAAASLLAAGSAAAHPGHGQARLSLDTLTRTLVHWLTEPEHVAMIVLVVGAIVGAVVLARRRGGGR